MWRIAELDALPSLITRWDQGKIEDWKEAKESSPTACPVQGRRMKERKRDRQLRTRESQLERTRETENRGGERKRKRESEEMNLIVKLPRAWHGGIFESGPSSPPTTTRSLCNPNSVTLSSSQLKYFFSLPLLWSLSSFCGCSITHIHPPILCTHCITFSCPSNPENTNCFSALFTPFRWTRVNGGVFSVLNANTNQTNTFNPVSI